MDSKWEMQISFPINIASLAMNDDAKLSLSWLTGNEVSYPSEKTVLMDQFQWVLRRQTE